MTSDPQGDSLTGDSVRGDDASHHNDVEQSPRSNLPLRIWPALVLAAGIPIALILPVLIENGPSAMWMLPGFGPLLCSMLILLWWITFSRARWQERVAGTIGIVGLVIATFAVVHPSMRGPTAMMVTIPSGLAGFALALAWGRKRLPMPRTAVALLVAASCFALSGLLRAEGMWGNFLPQLGWRWEPSEEEKLLAELKKESEGEASAFPAIEANFLEPEWAGLRGANRDARLEGVSLDTDWQQREPKLLWKIRVGPGWSSFAVAGNALFTQEQRGDEEVVVCYETGSGGEIWGHRIQSRFDDPLGGPGPRATPTLAAGGLFAMGASGNLVRLDPANGELQWDVDLKEVAGASIPMWGFSSSPAVIGSVVIVHAAGAGDKGVMAFDIETGETRWSAPSGKMSYSSPQIGSIEGKPYVLMASELGLDVIDPETGESPLTYSWNHSGYRACQPQLYEGSILIPTGLGSGTQRVSLSIEGDQWTTEELWTSLEFKPDFNDFVIHKGHAYGFDNNIFGSIDLETGKRNWKRGRYGKGQVLLLADCDKLLVTTEKGEIVLLQTDPEKHVELARFSAIDGKTWGHPALVGDRLYVRNSQEAACYRLPQLKVGE